MNQKRSVYIGASIEEMASAAAAALIGSARYDSIKRGDEHPMFLRLKVAYEGISRGAVTLAGRNDRPGETLVSGRCRRTGASAELWRARSVRIDAEAWRSGTRRQDKPSALGRNSGRLFRLLFNINYYNLWNLAFGGKYFSASSIGGVGEVWGNMTSSAWHAP